MGQAPYHMLLLRGDSLNLLWLRKVTLSLVGTGSEVRTVF